MFNYVPELNEPLLQLFPHRWDYLWSEHVKPGTPASWSTESRFPLSDRQILQGDFLYGVRFGRTTRYILLDIDAGSIYHPKRDPFAIGRMMEAFEQLGLTRYVALTSSYSGGLHLYLPFDQEINTSEIATGAAAALNQAGFFLEPGLLELFPNPRNWSAEAPTLYKGHRLPLQEGSYLLGDDWELLHTTGSDFCRRWQQASENNQLNLDALKLLLTLARRYQFPRMSQRAAKFLSDLDVECERGWTDRGQTNYLLGRIALRSYCFGHILHSSEPLQGERLARDIVETATRLPGYRDYCNHQHEIHKRAAEWARCVESSHYWPYRVGKPGGQQPEQPASPGGDLQEDSRRVNTWNQFQMDRARGRIRSVIADLLNQGRLPAGARERFLILIEEGNFSGETLYRHRDLWHPEHLWNTPPDPPNGETTEHTVCPADAATAAQAGKSLLDNTGRDTSDHEGYRQFVERLLAERGCNTPSSKDFSAFLEELGIDSG